MRARGVESRGKDSRAQQRLMSKLKYGRAVKSELHELRQEENLNALGKHHIQSIILRRAEK